LVEAGRPESREGRRFFLPDLSFQLPVLLAIGYLSLSFKIYQL